MFMIQDTINNVKQYLLMIISEINLINMVNYTLKQLYSFEAVIRLSSFTKASKELNITQPAVCV